MDGKLLLQLLLPSRRTLVRAVILFIVALGIVIGSSRLLYRHLVANELHDKAELISRRLEGVAARLLLQLHGLAYSSDFLDYFFNAEGELTDGDFKLDTVKKASLLYDNQLPVGHLFWVSDADMRYYEDNMFRRVLAPDAGTDDWYEAVDRASYYLLTQEFAADIKGVGHSYFRISVPVYQSDGKKAGVLGAMVSMEELGAVLKPAAEDKKDLLFMRGVGGQLLSLAPSSSGGMVFSVLTELYDSLRFLPQTPDRIIWGKSGYGHYALAPVSRDWSLVILTPASVGLYVLCFAFMFFMLSFLTAVVLNVLQTRRYIAENKIISAQKREIEILNENQSTYFSSMSHEIRTPINTIIGLDEMILREDISDEVAEDAQDIAAAGNILLSLINDILDMSKLESGKMEVVTAVYDSGAMLSDVVNMIWVKAKEKGLDFQVDITPELPASLIGDEVRIKQVLLNLLNNAIKYTKEGAVIFSVRSERRSEGEVFITYTVEDTGIGIKKDSIPYLFDAFKRVDMQQNHMIEGTGLGLSIVKQLVELMGGTIEVRSIYLKGSTFTVTLKQELAGEERIGQLNLRTRNSKRDRVAYQQSFEAPSARILIVDDNEMNLTVEQKLLRGTKVQVDTATSGRKALAMTQSVPYNAILLDHLMPEMDGITCLHEIRRQPGGLNRTTPAIALTANAGSKNQALYEQEGFDGYLSKPVSGIQLERTLLAVLPEELVAFHEDSVDLRDSSVIRLSSSKKLPLVITTDNVCDLPLQLLRSYGIPVLPGKVITNEGSFLCDLEIDTQAVLSYMQDPENTVRSDEPGVTEYEEFFSRQLQGAQAIIHITMSDLIGKAFANASEAAKSFDNITVVDSGLVSSGMGLLILLACQYAKENPSVQLVLDKIEESRKYFSTSFIVSSLEYLERNGRMPHLVRNICQTLGVHPVLGFRNGMMLIRRVEFGSTEEARMKYLKSVFRNRAAIDDSILFITYAGLPFSELEALKKQALALVPFKQVYYQQASPAIACNCGPGSVGFLFRKRG
ncbi:MAG: DegV family EDD domain-containing protein [Treponema sp.]|nr:DegV family EDD domain-containing protein [Treponema sp.]